MQYRRKAGSTIRKSYLIMYVMDANAGGQAGSVMAVAVMLSVLKAMGVI